MFSWLDYDSFNSRENYTLKYKIKNQFRAIKNVKNCKFFIFCLTHFVERLKKVFWGFEGLKKVTLNLED